MKVTYRWGKHHAAGDVDSPSFFLSNKSEGFCNFSVVPKSVYNGLFFSDGLDTYRTIENISVRNNNIHTINQKFLFVEREGSERTETFFMPNGKDALLYELNEAAPITLTLDVKRAYDGRVWGRNYKVSRRKDCTVIKFTKTSDNREDKASDEHEYTLYIAIKHDGKLEKNMHWIERMYDDDAARGETASRWVLDACTIIGRKLAIATAKKESEAIAQATYTFRNAARLKAAKSKEKHALPHRSLEQFAAYNAIDMLTTAHGIHAGHPWFFQYWSRDSLISAKALQPAARQKLLIPFLKQIQQDGNIPNRIPSSEIGAADSVGWLFFRAFELYNAKKLSSTAEHKVLQAIVKSIELLRVHRTSKDIIYNKPQETWMDTLYNDDGRFGARIEIQALLLAMYRFAAELSTKRYEKYEQQLKKKVLKFFFEHNQLKDGIDDDTIRPNIFIAYYVYPDLLTKGEWKRVFKHALDNLWLDWGGLSTLDKRHPNFFPEDSGNDSRSYHHGDSWYWMNNLAAICLHRLDKDEFKPQIEKIKQASIHNLLWQNSLGTPAEVSSASHQTSAGCQNQAWSAALLIELLEISK